MSWPGKVHSCSPVVPKLTGPWLFWLRQPPLLSPAVPDGEQEIRQGGQKFSPQLPGSAPAQEIERRMPGTAPTIAADQPKSPRLFLPSRCSPQERQPRLLLMATREHLGLPSHQTYPKCHLFHREAQLSSSWVLGRRQGGKKAGFPPVLHTRPALPKGAKSACLPAEGKHFSTEQTALLQRDCCSSRHLALAGTTIQRQPQH